MTLSSKRNQGQSVLRSSLCPRFHREHSLSISLVISEVCENRESTLALLGALPSTGKLASPDCALFVLASKNYVKIINS
jgi:hypothetical protein